VHIDSLDCPRSYRIRARLNSCFGVNSRHAGTTVADRQLTADQCSRKDFPDCGHSSRRAETLLSHRMRRNASAICSAKARAAAFAARPEGNTACTSTEPICQSGRTRTSERFASSLRDAMIDVGTIPSPATAAFVRCCMSGYQNSFRNCAWPQLVFYWPFKSEIDLNDLVQEFLTHGAAAALPVVVQKQQPLEFWRWRPHMRLARGLWNIPVPTERDVVEPTALLVPLLGFDAAGYRLGSG